MVSKTKKRGIITNPNDKQRIFFLGEIFWTKRSTWEGTGFHYCVDKKSRPAIVLKKSLNPMPVIVAPGTTKVQQKKLNDVFVPSEPVKYKKKKTESVDNFFILYLKRPVARDAFSSHLGTISGKDKQHLSNIINSEVRNVVEYHK
ncbi:MAG: hypothetical protein ACOX2F_02670 [bacterium]